MQQMKLFQDAVSEKLFSEWNPPEVPPDITELNFFIGTSGYFFDDWIGLFNPPLIPSRQFAYLNDQQKNDQDRLLFYQKYFSFLEINNTFYQAPAVEYFQRINEKSREKTLYSVKVNRKISHKPKQWNAEESKALMRDYVKAVEPIHESSRLYSLLIQLEDHNSRNSQKMDYLLKVSEIAVKSRMDVHIEFRHKSWHDDHVLAKLGENGIGICNTEIPPTAHSYPLRAYATNDKGYIRYSGLNIKNWHPSKKAGSSDDRTTQRNARYDYLYTEEEIRDRAKDQIKLSKKTKKTAVAYNNHFRIQAVKNAIDNIKFLAEDSKTF